MTHGFTIMLWNLKSQMKRYVKPVKKTPNAILEGIEDIVLFHYGHMMS